MSEKSIFNLADSNNSPFDIRLALFDIDGTLLDAHGHYPSELVKQIERIQSRGVKTAVASGRPHFAAKFVVENIGIKDPGVFCTGAHFYDPLAAQTLNAHFIDPVIALKLLERLQGLPLYYELYGEQEYYFETELGESVRCDHSKQLRVAIQKADLKKQIELSPTLKFLVGGEGAAGAAGLQQIKDLEQEFSGLIFAYARFPAHPAWHFASVISGSACKKEAFSRLLEYYNVTPEQVASFGDSQSDMVFLQSAGHGVAMGNSAKEVKEVARWETTSADEQGVVEALKRLI